MTSALSSRLLPGLGLVFLLPVVSGCPSEESPADDSTSTGTSGEDPTSESESDSGSETGEDADPNLVAIAGGSFEMGCGASDQSCDPNNPAHDVTVSDFQIERTEVSVAAYEVCVAEGGCTATTEGPDCNYGAANRSDHPINCVTWDQANDYCAWAGRRLPTEAEWEYAAAGPTSRTFPWGSAAADCTFAHMFQMSGDAGDYGCLTGLTAKVDDYEGGATPEGLLQLAGNVDEWVSDWYADDYYESGETTDPQGPASGTQKVNRGGDMFDASPLNLRVFERRNSDPDQGAPERGFRCAAD